MKQRDEYAELTRLMRRCGHFLWHKLSGKSSQENIIRILHQERALPQRELQERLRIQQSSVSEIVKKLEEQKLISKERDGQDRRKTILRLTEAGEAQDAVNRQKNCARDRRMFQVLDPEERAQLNALLTKLLDHWERDSEPEATPCQTERGEADA